jgi:hypothetical protein
MLRVGDTVPGIAYLGLIIVLCDNITEQLSILKELGC